MAWRKLLMCGAGLVAFLGVLSGFQNFQKPWREYPAAQYNGFPIPPDYRERTEYVFARLMYPNAAFAGRGFGRRYGRFRNFGDWREGRTSWTIDYPRSDRHFAMALRRLTRIHVRSVEQPINLDDHDQYDWPWLYAVEVGHWNLTDDQAKGLREYLLRGGFLMVDDFHGGYEWDIFAASMQRVFPDRPIVEIENKDQIFHVIYDLDDKFQVPGVQYVRSGLTYERADGFPEHWRGIYDDKGRLMVAICFNVDLGDSWEHADTPEYPQKFSAMGLRIGINYVAYAMTH